MNGCFVTIKETQGSAVSNPYIGTLDSSHKRGGEFETQAINSTGQAYSG
ncbi:MAG TPA: hypothetical protein VEL70_04715 [Candidatus Acidoferrum sp.]|nr:hypothetical protein [Candidatus Acidoferrum sp.]